MGNSLFFSVCENHTEGIAMRKIVTLICMMLLVGCATVKTEFVDPYGRQMPNPHFVLQAVGEPLLVTFYYTAYEEIKDVDGSSIAKPTFLDFRSYQNLSVEKYKAITLTIEVRNPKNVEYSLYEQVKYDTANYGGKVQKGGEINRSNQAYRQFVYRLPCKDGVRAVDHVVIVHANDHEIMRIGHFRYDLYAKGGERTLN